MLGFRVWSIENEAFIKDRDYLTDMKGNLMEFDGSNFLTSYEEEEDFILQQATGIYDRYEKEIYEGDILICEELPEVFEVIDAVYFISNYGRDFFNDLLHFTIVGNICQNPGLLER
jgi:hypothetical protein